MIIRQATVADIDIVAKISDEFSTFIERKNSQEIITIAQDQGSQFIHQVLHSNTSAIFIALDDEKAIGILEMHTVPRIRKTISYIELESMYINEDFQGTNVAADLMNLALQWAEKQRVKNIRLYSGFELARAHSFYEKSGFVHSGKTYKYTFED